MISNIIFILSFGLIFTQDDGTIVKLDKGKIQGRIVKSKFEHNFYSVQEIPYAAPPVGLNRYKLPQEPEPWDGILNTTRNTKICYQTNPHPHPNTNITETEDCLYINVYTPVKPGSPILLPVLLWIHGGAFIRESGIYEYYGPKYIMDHNVVVVSFNYRLGPLGFVGTDDGVIPLNLGLKDQRLAIEWVTKNIHIFGGNPNQVTLVGQSAGSISVGYHLISQKLNENLFHAVIMQSGTPISGVGKERNSTSTALNLGKAVDKTFSSSDTSELLTVLQKANVSDILNSGIFGGIYVEREGLFSYSGYQAFLDKNYKQVPVLLGFNSEEALASINSKNDTLLKQIDTDPSLLISKSVYVAPENRGTLGKLYKEIYAGNDSFINKYGGYIRYSSDSMITTGTSKQVEIASDDAPYCLYQFAYKGELGQQMQLIPPPGAERVTHAEDLRYMWDDTTNSDLKDYPFADRLMLHRYVKLWTNFVKYFNPTPFPDPLMDNLIWTRSNPNNLTYLNINETLEMRAYPRQYRQVKEILDKYLEPPFDSYS